MDTEKTSENSGEKKFNVYSCEGNKVLHETSEIALARWVTMQSYADFMFSMEDSNLRQVVKRLVPGQWKIRLGHKFERIK